METLITVVEYKMLHKDKRMLQVAIGTLLGAGGFLIWRKLVQPFSRMLELSEDTQIEAYGFQPSRTIGAPLEFEQPGDSVSDQAMSEAILKLSRAVETQSSKAGPAAHEPVQAK